MSYTAKTPDGETGTIENMPCIIMAKGSGFNQFEDEYLKKIPRSNKMYEFSTKMTLTKEKSGATVWWVMHYDPILDDPQPMDEDVYETLKSLPVW